MTPAEHLAALLEEAPDGDGDLTQQLEWIRALAEGVLIGRALDAADGDRTKAAALLGVDVHHLRRSLRRHPELLERWPSPPAGRPRK
jgi:DNA-binding NtrC family response regulator